MMGKCLADGPTRKISNTSSFWIITNKNLPAASRGGYFTVIQEDQTILGNG